MLRLSRTDLQAMRFYLLPALVASLVIFWVAPASVRADGVIRDGTGPISTGRGSTNLGFADNAAIIFDNPGGMSNVAGSGLVEGGVDTVIPSIHYSDPQNPSVNNVLSGCPCGMLGYIQHLEDTPWTVGLGAFSPAGFDARYDMNST